MRGATLAELQARRRATQDALTRLSQTLPSRFEQNRQIVTGDTAALAAGVLARIEIAKLETPARLSQGKHPPLRRETAQPASCSKSLKGELRAAATTLQAAEANCTSATKALQAFDDKWFGARWIAGGRRERRVLASEKTAACPHPVTRQQEGGTMRLPRPSRRPALPSMREKATIDTAVIAATDAIDELERNKRRNAASSWLRAWRMQAGGSRGLPNAISLPGRHAGPCLILLGHHRHAFRDPRVVLLCRCPPSPSGETLSAFALPGIGDSPAARG